MPLISLPILLQRPQVANLRSAEPGPQALEGLFELHWLLFPDHDRLAACDRLLVRPRGVKFRGEGKCQLPVPLQCEQVFLFAEVAECHGCAR